MDAQDRDFRWPPNRPANVDSPAGPGDSSQTSLRHVVGPPGPIRQALLDLEAAFLAPTATTWPPDDWTPEPSSAACPRCATSVGPSEADGDGCPACRNLRLRWERAFRLGEYHGDLAEAVQQVKFTAWRRLAFDLGIHLGHRLAPELGRLGIDPARARLVPMPTATARRLNRGIDHPLAIARGVRHSTGIPISRPLRKALRPPNADLPRSARRANVAGSIRLARTLGRMKTRSKPSLAGRLAAGMPAWATGGRRGPVELVILLDDVRTTGATMTAAARALKGHPAWFGGDAGAPATLWIAAVAVTPTSDRRLQTDQAPAQADSQAGPEPQDASVASAESAHRGG